MLGFTTAPTNMYVLLLSAFMVVAAAEPNCDPQTQYPLGDVCCKMCGPGTSFSGPGADCELPICQQCGEKEYQDKYTTEPKCHRQPYCDPNLNFEASEHDSKTRTVCTCKMGFHCTRGDCSGCAPHTTCKPGYGAKIIGNQTHDTVCEECPTGKYSDETSWSGVCKEQTECAEGYHLEKEGTLTSDNICKKDYRSHGALIGVMSLLSLIVLVSIITCFLCRGKRGDKSQNFKSCVESCMGPRREPLREDTGLMTTPPIYPQEEEVTLPEMESKPEDIFQRTPEENDDHHEPYTRERVFTENGNVVTQENGKTEVLSRQESQTQTFIE